MVTQELQFHLMYWDSIKRTWKLCWEFRAGKTWPNTKFMNLICMAYAAFILLACCLPLRSANTAFNFIVNTERCCRNGSSHSGISPELNWSQLYVICRCGQSGKVINLLASLVIYIGYYSLVITKQKMEFAQLYQYRHQTGKMASGKLVWK